MRKLRLLIIALTVMTVYGIHPQTPMPTAQAAGFADKAQMVFARSAGRSDAAASIPAAQAAGAFTATARAAATTATPIPSSNPQADALDMLRGTLDREPGVVRTQEENDTLLALTIGLSLTGFLLLIFSLSLALAIRPRLRRERAERIDAGIEDYGEDGEPATSRASKKQKAATAGDAKTAANAQIQPLQTSKPVLGTRIDLDAMSDSAQGQGDGAGAAESRYMPPPEGDDAQDDTLEGIPSAPLTGVDSQTRDAESQYIEDAFEGEGAGVTMAQDSANGGYRAPEAGDHDRVDGQTDVDYGAMANAEPGAVPDIDIHDTATTVIVADDGIAKDIEDETNPFEPTGTATDAESMETTTDADLTGTAMDEDLSEMDAESPETAQGPGSTEKTTTALTDTTTYSESPETSADAETPQTPPKK